LVSPQPAFNHPLRRAVQALAGTRSCGFVALWHPSMLGDVEKLQCRDVQTVSRRSAESAEHDIRPASAPCNGLGPHTGGAHGDRTAVDDDLRATRQLPPGLFDQEAVTESIRSAA
jgi:hypothetical protein